MTRADYEELRSHLSNKMRHSGLLGILKEGYDEAMLAAKSILSNWYYWFRDRVERDEPWRHIPPITTNPDGTTRPTVIAVDFDGCLASNAWPDVGDPNEELIAALILFKRGGGKIILWTCREGENLAKAVDFCQRNGIELDAVNSSLPDWIKAYGNNCRKVGADYYLDDKAIQVAFEVKKGRLVNV